MYFAWSILAGCWYGSAVSGEAACAVHHLRWFCRDCCKCEDCGVSAAASSIVLMLLLLSVLLLLLLLLLVCWLCCCMCQKSICSS
jgi:hypothetical protein